MHNWVTTIFWVITIWCVYKVYIVSIFLIGVVRGESKSGAGKFITLSECNKPGLTGCIETPSDDSCTECSLVFLTCINTFLDTHHNYVILMHAV